MELFPRPLTFLVILGRSISLLPNNISLIAFISIFSLLLHSSLSFLFFFAPRHYHFSPLPSSFLHQLNSSSSSSNVFDFPDFASPNFNFNFTSPFPPRRQIASVLAIQLAFLIAFSAVSLLSTLSTVVVASMSYHSRSLSLSAFFSTVFRSSAPLLLTSLHVLSLTLGYFALLAAIASPLLIYLNFHTLPIILFSIFTTLLFLYLLVPFLLSLVISVIEPKCRGLEALGKAAALIKGQRAHAFFLNVCFSALVFGVSVICRTLMNRHWESSLIRTVLGLVAANIAFLVKIFVDVVYTVLYFHCKKDHGEEIELYGSLQYSKLPTTVLTMGLDDEDDDSP